MKHTVKTKLTVLTKLTIAGLIGVAVALWTLWLSGDPAFPRFPPGPVIFIAAAAIVAMGSRWWWTPLIGALIGLLVTSGWFARFPTDVQLLIHPGSAGKFAPGILAGAVLQVAALVITDIAGVAATIQNYRRMLYGFESSWALLRWIWHFLSDAGHPWPADGKPLDEQGLAYRANAAIHRRSHLSSRIRLYLSEPGSAFGANSERQRG